MELYKKLLALIGVGLLTTLYLFLFHTNVKVQQEKQILQSEINYNNEEEINGNGLQKENDLTEKIMEKYIQDKYSNGDEEDELNIAFIGDYGTGKDPEIEVAKKFNEIAEEVKADFVLTSGDNFYYPNGVESVDDESWNSHWADVYQNQSYLKNLYWYGVLGNHDYGGKSVKAQFEYRKHNWMMKDFFWTQTALVGDLKVAIIHIDTNFLAYGYEGDKNNNPNMKIHFAEQGWLSNQQILNLIEQELIQHQDADWKLAIGHHPIGHACRPTGNTEMIYPLLEKYKVDAYLMGHSHQLSFTLYNRMAFYLSGAGAREIPDNCAESDPVWSKGNIQGFMTLKITRDYISAKAYYIDYRLLDYSQKYTVEELPIQIRRSLI